MKTKAFFKIGIEILIELVTSGFEVVLTIYKKSFTFNCTFIHYFKVELKKSCDRSSSVLCKEQPPKLE